MRFISAELPSNCWPQTTWHRWLSNIASILGTRACAITFCRSVGRFRSRSGLFECRTAPVGINHAVKALESGATGYVLKGSMAMNCCRPSLGYLITSIQDRSKILGLSLARESCHCRANLRRGSDNPLPMQRIGPLVRCAPSARMVRVIGTAC